MTEAILAQAAIARAHNALMMARDAVDGTDRGTQAKSFIRRVIRHAMGLGEDACISRWPIDGEKIHKSAIGAITSADLDAEARVFIGLAAERSIIGRLQNLRKVPFNTRMIAVTGGALAYWSGETKLRPLSKVSVAGETLRVLTLSAIIAATKEAFFNPAAESVLQNDVLDALAAVLDETFLSNDPGVPDERPGGIADGAPSVLATGNIADDLAALLNIFSGDLETASIISTPAAAVRLALASGGNPQILAGPNGGKLFGFPFLTTRHMESGSNGDRLLIVDAAGITANFSGVNFSKTEAACLAMSDDPESEPQLVSLFQTGTVGLKADIYANWNVSRAGAVAVLEGI
jgi:Phage capsid family.